MTCNAELAIKIPVHHRISLGKSQNRKTGKHTLLTVVEDVYKRQKQRNSPIFSLYESS